MQGRTVWRMRSGDSVSILLFGYLFFYFVAIIDYAVAIKSITLFCNALLFLCVAPLFLGLFWFKKLTWGEVFWVISFSSMPVVMILSSHKEKVFLYLLVGMLIFFIAQAYELWIAKRVGSIDPRMLVVSCIVTAFWFVYGCMIGDIALISINPLFFAVNIFSLGLWVHYSQLPA